MSNDLPIAFAQMISIEIAGVVITDANADVVYVNPTFERFTGYSQSELLGKNCRLLQGNDRDQAGIHELHDAVAEQHEVRSVVRNYRKDGSPFWNEIHITPARDASGKVTHFIGLMNDVTQRIEMERGLQQSDERLRMLAETADDFIVEFDELGRFTYVSTNVVDFLGIPAETMLNTSIPEMVEQFVPASDQPDVLPLPSGAPLPEPIPHMTYALRFPDGRRLWIEARGIWFINAEGVQRGLAVCRDMSQVMLNQEALRESEEKFRELAEHISEVFWMSDPDTGKITYVSPAYETIWGRTVDAIYENQEDWIEAIHSDHREHVEKSFLEKAPRGEFDEVYRIMRPDGAERWIHDRGFPVRDAAGEVQRIAGIAQDITQQVRNVSAMRETEKLAAAGRMAARVAHEINNPLAGIKNAFALVKKAVPEGHADLHYADRIESEIARISRIVRQMFELYRPEGDLVSSFDLRTVTNDVALLIEPSAESRDVRLETSFGEDSLEVHLPESNCRQVLFNLIHNAVDASPDGARVHVSVRRSGELVRIRVIDEGTGISEDIAQHVFEPFFTTREEHPHRGLGLGLSIAKSLVEAMGGTINFRPNSPSGTVFDVEVPLRDPRQTG